MSAGGSLSGGKSKGKETVSSQAATDLAQIAKGFADETQPLRQSLIDIMLSVLQTGGTGGPITTTRRELVGGGPSAPARTFLLDGRQYYPGITDEWGNLIPAPVAKPSEPVYKTTTTQGTSPAVPIISRAVEQSRRASSKALSDTDKELAQQGLAGTPFGAMIKANQRREGNIAAGQTQQSLAQAIFNMIPNFLLGQGQTALSGLAGAIPGMNTTKAKGQTFGWGTSGGFNYGGGK